jgi:hypothetical protein
MIRYNMDRLNKLRNPSVRTLPQLDIVSEIATPTFPRYHSDVRTEFYKYSRVRITI